MPCLYGHTQLGRRIGDNCYFEGLFPGQCVQLALPHFGH